jgi:EAL domain-containing protein (putative c-di-GMP-specific phosphodiesterase class I)
VELERRRYTLTSIRSAIDRNELVPFYQPIFSLQDGSLVAFEALVRWVKAKGLIAAPGAFSAALHDPVLSDLIGTYMIQKVVSQIASWENKGLRGFRVAVNVAAGQLRGGKLAATVLEELRSYSVEPKRLAVEITETVLLSYHSDEVADILRELHGQGVRIALDDFGTGYASLSHLRDFPVDTVKIDKSFVQNMLTSEQSASIVEAIINLSHNLKKTVTAEGIESIEIAARLRKLGCDNAQGYIFGRPMPAEQAQALLTHPKFTGTGQPAAQRIARLRSVS